MTAGAAITGLHWISPLGTEIEDAWSALREGRCAIGPVGHFDASAFPTQLGGFLRDFDPSPWIRNHRLQKLMSRDAEMAVFASIRAARDAGWDIPPADPFETGLFFGTGLASGEINELVPVVERAIGKGGELSDRLMGEEALPACNPLLSFKILTNMPLSYVAILLGIRGPNMVLHPWTSSAAQAIGEALRAIQDGSCRRALAGGADSKCHLVSFLTWEQMGLLRGATGEPVHTDTDGDPVAGFGSGVVLSEGGAVMALEGIDDARARGARCYAVLSGYGQATEPRGAPGRGTIARAMAVAMDDAGVAPGEIDTVHANLSGHLGRDREELLAVGEVIGGHARIYSTKPLLGDMGTGASPFEVSVASLGIHRGEPLALPHLGAYEGLLPPHEGGGPSRWVIVNAIGYGTTAVSLVLRRP